MYLKGTWARFEIKYFIFLFCFEHILLTKQKDQKQVLTTYKFLFIFIMYKIVYWCILND